MAKTTKELKTTLDWANAYITFGLKVLPCYAVKNDGDCMCPPQNDTRFNKETGTYGACKSAGKHPVSKLAPRGALSASSRLDDIKKWFGKDREYNIAVATGKCHNENNLVVTDLDVTKGKDGPATWDALQKELGEKFPDTLRQITGSGGKHYFWWTDSEVSNSSESKLGSGIDVRGKGGYVMVPPSRNALGEYTWENWKPQPHVILAAPKSLEDRAHRGKPAPKTVNQVVAKPTPRTEPTGLVLLDDPHDTLMFAQLEELLKYIPSGPRDNWLKAGGIIKTIAGEKYTNAMDRVKLFNIWDEWAKTGDGYGGIEDQQNQWDSFPRTETPPIICLKKLARENGWTASEEFLKLERTHWKDTAQAMFDALPDNAEPDSDGVAALFKVLTKLPEINREVFIKDKINKRFRSWGVQSIRNAVKQQKQKQTAADSEFEIDEGMLVARSVLAKHYENGKLLIRGSDRCFWKYNGKYWELINNSDEVIGRQCLEEIDCLGPTRLTKAMIKNQAIDLLKSLRAREDDPLRLTQPPLPVINCQNWEVWIKEDFTIELNEHSPGSYLRFCLDIDYDPEAKCPMFDEALLAIFQKSPQPEDMRRHLYEVLGYAIQPGRWIKQFWLWEGEGDNGKTAIMETLKRLIGMQSYYPVDIRRISQEYYISHLKSKLVLCDDDVNFNTVLPDGMLKQLSEGKGMLGRDPHGKPVEFISCVLPMLLCNKYPITRDLGRGVQTRAQVIPFRHSFVETNLDGSPGDMDRELFQRIWKTELPGLLNRCIEGLQRLRERGRYQEPEDCLRAKEEFLQQANPLPRFINEACITNKTDLAKVRIEAKRIVLRRYFVEDSIDNILLFDSQGEGMESIDIEATLAMARAEAGMERLGCKFTDLYKEFWQWSRNEGISMAHKPTRSDVERYLHNLGFAMTREGNQKWVDGVKAIAQADERPSDAM